jgi:hypothetical protein
MTNWKEIRHQVQDRIRNVGSSSKLQRKNKGEGEGKSKKEITPQEAVALIASIIIIILAIGGLGIVYNVFAQQEDESPLSPPLSSPYSSLPSPLTSSPGEDPIGPEGYKKAIDACMVSVMAMNPRPAALTECDVLMPLVPALVESQMIEDIEDVKQKTNEYLHLRALEVNTDMLEQAKNATETPSEVPTVTTLEELEAVDPAARNDSND